MVCAVALAVDGSASNDSGHLLAEARLGLLLQRVGSGATAMPVRETSVMPSSRMMPINVSIFDALPVTSNTKCSVEVSTT